MNTNLDNNSNTICTRCGCSTSSYTKGLCCKCSRNKTITKIILYFIFIAVYSIIITSLGMFAHIQIGGIPTVILLGITLYLPHIIVNKIFSRRKITKTKQTKTMESLPKKQTVKKTNQTKNINTQSTLSDSTKTTEIYKNKTVFCKKCGNKLDDNKKCTSCGKQYFYPQRIIKNMQSKYCKACGGIIDTNTRKCTSCQKQYFKISKIFNKCILLITSIILVVSISITTFMLVTQKRYTDDIIISQSHIVKSGANAYVHIKSEPKREYKITVTYSDGTNETIGVTPRNTDSFGECVWNWHVLGSIRSGTCTIRIESDFEYTTTTMEIY